MRALRRTLKVLEALAQAPDGLTLSDVARASNLDGSTALRYLNELTKLGYAACHGGSKPRYFSGPRLVSLGGGSKLTVLRQVARPHMEVLGQACGENVTLAILDGGHVLCLETRRSSHVLGANLEDGLRTPVHASSLGKAVLAFMPRDRVRALIERCGLRALTPNTVRTLRELEAGLDEVRRRGYATDREEFALGVVCIGAPIFDASGLPVAALSITAPTLRLSLEELESRYAGLLLATCRRISEDLGHSSELEA